MTSTLRDELASLKIDRRGPDLSRPTRLNKAGDRGFGLLALLLWLIPLGLIVIAGVYAYKQYEHLRSKPEVSVGLVQTMTSGEAEKLLIAKGYLKSRYQAMIGAKIPGRVERMFVQEGSKVKKGDVLAVLEHDEMKAYLAARKAMLAQNEAQLQECKVEQKQKEREALRAGRLHPRRTSPSRTSKKRTRPETCAPRR